jgi:hypothetical protein
LKELQQKGCKVRIPSILPSPSCPSSFYFQWLISLLLSAFCTRMERDAHI